jgi:hypothetical protein
MSGFLALGLVGGEGYQRLPFSFDVDLKRGMEEKIVAVEKTATLSSLLTFLEDGRYLEWRVFDEGREIASFSQKELGEWILSSPLQSTIEENLYK